MVSFLFNKDTLPSKMKKYGATKSRGSHFSLMVKPTPVVLHINIYNASSEPEQLHTLNDLINILGTFEHIQNKNVALGGDFNVI